MNNKNVYKIIQPLTLKKGHTSLNSELQYKVFLSTKKFKMHFELQKQVEKIIQPLTRKKGHTSLNSELQYKVF